LGLHLAAYGGILVQKQPVLLLKNKAVLVGCERHLLCGVQLLDQVSAAATVQVTGLQAKYCVLLFC
jgi:hypothetical protein